MYRMKRSIVLPHNTTVLFVSPADLNVGPKNSVVFLHTNANELQVAIPSFLYNLWIILLSCSRSVLNFSFIVLFLNLFETAASFELYMHFFLHIY